MKRLPFLFLLVLSGCPEPTLTGDVQLGDYLVDARRREGGCAYRPGAEDAETFQFLARIAADLDGGPAWITVQQPPGAVSQQPRRGVVADGGLHFEQQQVQDLTECGCLVRVTETIAVNPQAAAAEPTDGGVPDAGEAQDEAPIPGLPHPDAIEGVGGAIDYDMVSGGSCPPPEDLPDGGFSGCVLPCRFGYDLTGVRQE